MSIDFRHGAPSRLSVWRWLLVLGLCSEAGRQVWRCGRSMWGALSGPAVFESADAAVRFGLGAAGPALDAVRAHTSMEDLILIAYPPGLMVPLFMHVQPRLSGFLGPDVRVDPRAWSATSGTVWYLDLGTGRMIEHAAREKVAGDDAWALWRLDR
ncbi:MAG: hypothetical protein AB7I19_05640 [Planctomycetota bacterium]